MSLTFHSSQEVDSNFLETGSSSQDVALYRGDVTDTAVDEAVAKSRLSSVLRLEIHIPRTDIEKHRELLESRGFKVVGTGVTHFSPRYEFVRFGLLLRGPDPALQVHPLAQHPEMRVEMNPPQEPKVPQGHVDLEKSRIATLLRENGVAGAAALLSRG
jgi:hypothetical protein